MTKYSAETARSLFDKHGYSDTCDFVRISDSKRGRFISRCKTCGHEFERDTNILRVPQKRLRCPKCYEQLQSDVLDYYAAGHSSIDCAERFGITKAMVQNFAKKHRVSGGMSQQERGKYAKAAQKKACAASVKAARERSVIRDNDKRIRKEWRDLNDELTQWRRTLKAIHEIQSAKLMKQRLAAVSREIDAMETYEPKVATCKHCGKEWLFWPSRDRYAHHKPPTFCSVRCNNNHHYNRESDNHRHRARKYGVAYESGITLDKIEERDGGICYLCGGKTNRNDSWKTTNGFYGTGALYPSQDHVVPMVRGGDHIADNIRLAHKRCNELKGDKLLSELQLPFSIPKGAVAS